MNEILFLVEELPEGGYTARCLGPSIFTEAGNWEQLQVKVSDAVKCHYETDRRRRLIRLHFVRDLELMP